MLYIRDLKYITLDTLGISDFWLGLTTTTDGASGAPMATWSSGVPVGVFGTGEPNDPPPVCVAGMGFANGFLIDVPCDYPSLPAKPICFKKR